MKNLFPSSIRSKLLLLAVLAFLPVVLLTVLNSWHQRRLEVAGVKERMEKILDFAVLHEEEIIRDTHRILAMLADVPILPKGGKPASEFLARLLKNSPEYTNFVVCRPDGQVIASAVTFIATSNFSDRPYFQDVLKNKSYSIGQYTVGRITGKPIIVFGYPVLDRQGNVIAVLLAPLDLSRVTRFEAEMGVQAPANSPYVKIDDHGIVLSAYPEEQMFGRGHPLEESLFKRISKEKKGTFEAVGVDGVERFYLFSPYRGPINKEGGYALLGIPTKTLFAKIDRQLVINLAVLSIVAVLFFAIIWIGGNTLIARPVGVLAGASKRLAAGEFTARSRLESTQGELGQLSRSFDDMAEELQRRQEDSLRMQETLRVSVAKAESEKAKTESIIAGIGDGISIHDKEYKIIYQNQVQKNLVGDHVGEFCYAMYDNRDRICEGCPLALSFRDGQIYTKERMATVNGKTIHVEITSSPLRDASGNIVAGIEVIRDITERVRSGEALQESEARYRGLFEHMQEGFAYCKMIFENGDPVDFIYLSVNAAFDTLTGLKGVVGKRVSEAIPGIRTSDPALFDTYGRVACSGIPEKFEIFVEALQQWFLISAYSPEPGYFVTVFDVITKQKRAEAEKEKLQAQLLQAMKMEAVGRLAGGVAHDFNNLLTVIIGNVELALGKVQASAPVAGMLSEANKAAERAARLTQQLLAFSRKQIIEPKDLNLNDLIADLNAMLVRLIREDIKIQFLPGRDLGVVKVDAGQFQQVLVNLVVNARDAMPGGGKIVIETSNAELDDGYCSSHPYVKPGRYVMVAVSDTGQGMEDEVKSHIFEPFFTTKAKGVGTGLGLATAYGAVKQAGGSIEVYSEPGMGTTFKVYLPQVAGEASKLVRDDRPQKPLGGTETVLLVEDEDIVRNMCVRVLDELGYKVLPAGNGDEAIALALGYGERVDLLLTDVVMPGMNGRELVNRLTRIHPETKVLFTSGYTDNAIVHHGVLDEGVSFIGKPYSPSALAKKIREVLDNAG